MTWQSLTLTEAQALYRERAGFLPPADVDAWFVATSNDAGTLALSVAPFIASRGLVEEYYESGFYDGDTLTVVVGLIYAKPQQLELHL